MDLLCCAFIILTDIIIGHLVSLHVGPRYCKTLIFSEPFNLAKLAIEIKTLKIKATKII